MWKIFFIDVTSIVSIMYATFRKQSSNRSRRRRMVLRKRAVKLASDLNSISSSDSESDDPDCSDCSIEMPSSLPENPSYSEKGHTHLIKESTENQTPIEQSPLLYQNRPVTIDQAIHSLS